MTSKEIVGLLKIRSEELSNASKAMYEDNKGNSIMGGKLAFASIYLNGVINEIEKTKKAEMKEPSDECVLSGDSACNGCDCNCECSKNQ